MITRNFEITHRCECETCDSIIQVKRLSDNQLFTVYDRFIHGEEIIEVHELKIQNDKLFVIEWQNVHNPQGEKNIYDSMTLELLTKGIYTLKLEADGN